VEGDVTIPKDHPSAFFETGLAATLRSLGVERVLLVGNSTSGCVRATAVDARAHGCTSNATTETTRGSNGA